MKDGAGFSAEQVAYNLMQDIAYAERRDFRGTNGAENRATKGWIINTYRECLEAVKGVSQS